MKVKIQYSFNGDITEEDVHVIFKCKHVNDKRLYSNISSIEKDEESSCLLIENTESPYGFSVLWLKDRINNIYEYAGFGNSLACSIVTCLLQERLSNE